MTLAQLPVVAIVGRPNVGKSALFNRIVGGRPALVEDLPGTTRDRIYGDAEWRGRAFQVVDTGGLEPDEPGTYTPLVRAQVEYALREADVILFVVDAKSGTTAADEEVADLLRRTNKPVLLLANKAENRERQEAAIAFFELGLGEPTPISASHGLGVAEALDLVVDTLAPAELIDTPEGLRLAIVGRPNVGKSALLNAVLGEDRVIVSDVPGTTRDAIDTPFTFADHRLVLIDTAGLRRRGSIEAGVEKHSALRARRALERADVALCVFDLAEGFTAQDAHVVGYALDAAKGVVVVANKWDLVRDGDWTREDFERRLRWKLKFAPWISIRFVSALECDGIEPLLEEAVRIGAERDRHIETGALNHAIRRAVAEKPPPNPAKTGRLKLLYVTQAETNPPTFVFFVNEPSRAHFGYRRYMENVIRRTFGFEGTAIRLVFRGRNESEAAREAGG
ncbi:MAG TPA: ribosome biogenesis GTPase Der [Dehalococcoidia bacterium]|nr:ribosome biogenesis GTPase Der [Dehalococcoidia bacterium]